MQDKVRGITSNKKDIAEDNLEEMHYLNAVITVIPGDSLLASYYSTVNSTRIN